MTTKRDLALALAERGFHVFPVREQEKLPAITGWQDVATTDRDQIEQWWTCPLVGHALDRNIGVCTTRFGADRALVVVDVDVKHDVDGNETVLNLACEGFDLPATLEGATPTGGRHLIYWTEIPVNQRKAGFLGPGVDVRSRGGYIVAHGSETADGLYRWKGGKMAKAPDWLVERLGAAPESVERAPAGTQVDADDPFATSRVQELLDAAPECSEGGRNSECYRIAARVRDLGFSHDDALDHVREWNDTKCLPPLDDDEVERTVRSTYRTARGQQGGKHPAHDFQSTQDDDTAPDVPEGTEHPLKALNDEYALVLAGGGHHILRETTDEHDNFCLEHLTETAFHRYHAANLWDGGNNKLEPLTKSWMAWKGRRTYDGLVFAPGQDIDTRWYNLWRGFRVEPIEDESQISQAGRDAVDAWFEHARENVCQRDKKLYNWLMNYLAHMVQYPHEKAMTALVLRGGKGVGKDSFMDRIGFLLGHHYMMTSNRRYIIGTFNGHLERLLMFVLNEAFWSGDKAAEGQLKDLVTGATHVIEHKGKEPYTVDNLTRVVVIGNERWLVPASEDERRWAVFDIGDGRKQDRRFFTMMRKGIDEGDGAQLLLKRLLEWPVDRMEVNRAPKTSGLADQKLASLDPISEWWMESLAEQTIRGGDFPGWPDFIATGDVYSAFCRTAQQRHVRSRLSDQMAFGRHMKRLCPALVASRRTDPAAPDSGQKRVYNLPPIEQARAQFERYIGQEVMWPDD